ncbi:hypothetical protein ACLB2K_012028 [Fragaria x ananassa]
MATKTTTHSQTYGLSLVKTAPPHLPEDIVRQVISLLPTNSAFRMSFLSKQFEDVSSFLPVLDLDEGDDEANLNEPIQDVKFTNIFERYLKFREKNCKPLNKFRLRMAMDTIRKDIVQKLLRSFAAANSINDELDLSLRSEPRGYCINLALLNLNSLTTLSLEYVRIKGLHTCSLPSLKTMSLKSIHWSAPSMFSALLSKCPSIQYLSLTSCGLWGSINVSSSKLTVVGLHECENLKYMNIDAKHLPDFGLYGCTDFVMAIMDAPNLDRCNGQELGGMNGRFILSDFQWSRGFRKNDPPRPLDKLRLRMEMNPVREAIMSFAAERSIKELDLSLKTAPLKGSNYSLSLKRFNVYRHSFVVSSSTVKSLEIRDCVIGYAEVRRSKNLESFTWVSSSPELRHAALLKGQSLKYINLKGIMQRSCGGHNVYSKSKIFQFQWFDTQQWGEKDCSDVSSFWCVATCKEFRLEPAEVDFSNG